MASSRKDLLNRYAELGFKHGDVRGTQTAIRLEIQERKEQYEELKKNIGNLPSGDSAKIDNLSKQITDLQTQITTLEDEARAETATRILEVTHINETIATLQSTNGLNEAEVNTLISAAFEILQDQINYLNSQITSSGS